MSEYTVSISQADIDTGQNPPKSHCRHDTCPFSLVAKRVIPGLHGVGIDGVVVSTPVGDRTFPMPKKAVEWIEAADVHMGYILDRSRWPFAQPPPAPQPAEFVVTLPF